MNETIHDATCNTISPLPSTQLIVIDRNVLARCCITQSLSAYDARYEVHSYSAVDEWAQSEARDGTPIILLFCHSNIQFQSVVSIDIDRIRSIAQKARIIVVADTEESSNILAALSKNVNGYISLHSNLDVAVAAIRLVQAGGTFVPAGSLRALSMPAQNKPAYESPFTSKQLAVIERLRQGESNKIIAFRLAMEECTVKVHIRNIMKKIRARNRTEIAFLTNHMFQEQRPA